MIATYASEHRPKPAVPYIANTPDRILASCLGTAKAFKRITWIEDGVQCANWLYKCPVCGGFHRTGPYIGYHPAPCAILPDSKHRDDMVALRKKLKRKPSRKRLCKEMGIKPEVADVWLDHYDALCHDVPHILIEERPTKTEVIL